MTYLKTSDLKKKIFIYELSSKKKIVLISIKNHFKISDVEKLGAELLWAYKLWKKY